MGYTNPNVLTMFKQGKTKLPVSKVKLAAQSLQVDPIHLLKLTLIEYMPDTWDVIESILGKAAITESEFAIIKIVRENSKGLAVEPTSDDAVNKLAKLVEEWVAEYEADVRSAMTAQKL